jgi:phosphoglucosamine mutase
MALGTAAWRSQSAAVRVPRVLLGADGHWSTADLVHAAGEALVWAGCQAVEVGAVTTSALAFGAQARGADAALWIGNATGRPHAISLCCFGQNLPWSSPGELDAVRDLVMSSPQRPKRGGGGLERADLTAAYLAPLETWFHALRPLRFVVDTCCEPWLASMNSLAGGAACEVVRAVGPDSGETPPLPVAETWLERRLRSISRRVVAGGAHFGLWVDGAGESVRLVDERGHSVDGQGLCRLLARHVCRERSGAVVVLEPAAHLDTRRALEALDASVVIGGETREATSRAIEESGATLAAGPSGRFWFAGHSPAPDALLATSLLLSILSQSDRPLSDVLDEA